jgi:hypothetical protein
MRAPKQKLRLAWSIPTDRPNPRKIDPCDNSCCTAVTGSPDRGRHPNKSSQINVLTACGVILTWSDAISMVRAAFEGDGRNFHQPQHRLVSWAWPKTRTTMQVGIAISRRPTKLRFPQGSEVWIIGCPKFATTAKSGLINPELKAETGLPEHRQWRLVSGFPRNWSRALPSGRRWAGGSTVYCRLRRSVSSCFCCSASSPVWSTW